MIFRQSDDGYYALIAFPPRAGQPGFLSVVRVLRLNTTELNRWALLRTAAPAQRIEVRCREADCEIYDEGNLRGKVKDNTFSQGRVGLYLSGKGDALFHNLTVEEQK